MMTWMKIKFAAGMGVAALLAGGVATVAISQTSSEDKLTPQEIAKQAQDAYAALSSYSDNGTAVTEGGGQTATTAFNIHHWPITRACAPRNGRTSAKASSGLMEAEIIS